MSVHVIDPRTGRKPTPGQKGRRAYKVRWARGERQFGATFDRRADADAFDLELRRRRQAGGTARTADSVTLDEWRRRRWERDHARDLAPATRALYTRIWQRTIKRRLGQLPLSALTITELAEWQAQLLDRGLSPDAVGKARTVLGSVLTHAAREQVTTNHLAAVRRPRRAHRDEVEPLPPSEVERIRAQLTNPRDRIIVSLLAYAGLRPGELRALRWGDRREHTLLVQRAANPDGTTKATKTRTARTVRLLAPLAADLDEWAQHTTTARRVLILTGAPGSAWTAAAWANWRRRAWTPAVTAAGLEPHPRPYNLRHSFASLLLAEGRPVLDVAAQLGHSPQMCLRVYGHVIDEYAELPAGQRPIAADEITTARAAFPTTSQPGTDQRSERADAH